MQEERTGVFRAEDGGEEEELVEVMVKLFATTVNSRGHFTRDFLNPTHPSCQYCKQFDNAIE